MSDQADRAVEYMKQEREDAQDLRQICNRIDFDGNGRIAWPEFEAYTWLHRAYMGDLVGRVNTVQTSPSEHLFY